MLYKRFELKDFREVQRILGMEVEYNRKSRVMTISQREAINKLIERFRMRECKVVSTPMEHLSNLKEEGESETSSKKYRSAIGSLMYILMARRPHLAFCLDYWSQFLENPTEQR